MTDPLTGALLSAGATLLGSLNKRTAKTDLEAARLLDEEDPIRRAFEAFPIGSDIDARIFFADGCEARLTKVLEVGYGAARVKIQMLKKQTVRGTNTEHFAHSTVAVVRFSAVSIISVQSPA